MAIEIVDLPSYKMVDLSIVTLVYQRVFSAFLGVFNSPKVLMMNADSDLYCHDMS